MSTSHFRRLFKQVLGWAPLDYGQMVRIDRAGVLLYDCDLSVTEISMQVGYPSPSSFNRQFRKIHGVSPSQWRQKVSSEENPIATAYFNSLPLPRCSSSRRNIRVTSRNKSVSRSVSNGWAGFSVRIDKPGRLSYHENIR